MFAITPNSTASPDQPLLIDIKKVARLLGRSEESIVRDDRNGRLPRPLMLGGSKRWDLGEIQQWVQAKCPSRDLWESRPDKNMAPDAKGGG